MKHWLRALALGLTLAIGTVGATSTLSGCESIKKVTGNISEQDILMSVAASKSLITLANKTVGELADANATSPDTLQTWATRLDFAHGLLNQAEAALPNINAALAKINEANSSIEDVRTQQAAALKKEGK